MGIRAKANTTGFSTSTFINALGSKWSNRHLAASEQATADNRYYNTKRIYRGHRSTQNQAESAVRKPATQATTLRPNAESVIRDAGTMLKRVRTLTN